MAEVHEGMEQLAEESKPQRKYGAGTEKRATSKAPKKYAGEQTTGSTGAKRVRTSTVKKPLHVDSAEFAKAAEGLEKAISDVGTSKPRPRRTKVEMIHARGGITPDTLVKTKPSVKVPKELAAFQRDAERAAERLQRETERYNLRTAKSAVKDLEREAKECNKNSERVGIALQKAQAHLGKLEALAQAE